MVIGKEEGGRVRWRWGGGVMVAMISSITHMEIDRSFVLKVGK